MPSSVMITGEHTPHGFLVLGVSVLDIQRHHLGLRILRHLHIFRNFQVKLSYHPLAIVPLISTCRSLIPKGPFTVMVFLYTFLYDVKSLLATGSPTDSSTPGGIDRGVLPSLDGRFEVVEKRAMAAREDAILGAVACHAGTRKLGRVTGPDDEAAMARPIALPRLGVNMAAIGVEMAAVGVQQY